MDELERDLVKYFAKCLISVDSFKDRLKLKWINRSAALLANRLYLMLGKVDVVEKDVKGYVKWNNLPAMFNESGKCYREVIVMDTITKIHFVPSIHMDYMMMSMDMELSEDTIEHIPKISDGLEYDNGILTARSDFPAAIIAKFAIVKYIDEKKLSIGDARDTYRTWLKICHEEWCSILEGVDVREATLTTVLEKYIHS